LSRPFLMSAVVCAASTGALAQSAVRDLPDPYVPPPASTMTIFISVTTPGGTGNFGAEDRPPSGWTVSNISGSGSFDALSGKVKWGPFFAPSFPSQLSYDLSPAGATGGCFGGTASWDGFDQPIAGEDCFATIPAASAWSVLALAELLMIGATMLILRPAVDHRMDTPPVT